MYVHEQERLYVVSLYMYMHITLSQLCRHTIKKTRTCSFPSEQSEGGGEEVERADEEEEEEEDGARAPEPTHEDATQLRREREV